MKQEEKKETENAYRCPVCLEEYEEEGDERRIECESCSLWYHTDCVDISGEDIDFICNLCL